MPRLTLEGKRRFFFSHTDDDKEWRVTEKIVAVIESFLQPFDAVVFSPKRVKNIVGDLEELDVVFQPLGDPTAPFNFIQVRDRDEISGRPWLQQLIGQQETLGRGNGTLVSTSGFADTVKRLAAAKRIPIRTLHGAPSDNIGKWFAPRAFGVNIDVFSLVKCAVVVVEEGKAVTMEFENHDLRTGITLIADHEADRFRPTPPVALFDRLVVANQARRKLLSDVLERNGAGARTTVSIDINMDKPPIWLDHSPPERPLPVLAVVFFVQLDRRRIDAAVVDRYRYEDAETGKELAQAVVGEFSSSGAKNYIALIRTDCDGETCQIGGAYFS